MSERTKRAGAIVAVMAFMLAMAAIGYWLGRSAAVRRNPTKAVAISAHDRPPVAPAKPVETPAKARKPMATNVPIVVRASSIPQKWRLAGVSEYQTGKDVESWLGLYADHDGPIGQFNLRHPFAWSIHSPEDIAWMAQNGFPMPEDIIAADSMSDDALRQQADAGSKKAEMLYYERLQSEWSDAVQAAIDNGASAEDALQKAGTAMPEVQAELTRIDLDIRQMETPYFGYVEANRVLFGVDENTREDAFAAGLAVAYARGDDRAVLAVLAAQYNNLLTPERANMASRVMAEMRDFYPVPGACDTRISTPFPKPGY